MAGKPRGAESMTGAERQRAYYARKCQEIEALRTEHAAMRILLQRVLQAGIAQGCRVGSPRIDLIYDIVATTDKIDTRRIRGF
jgi:hypothetical protein